MFAFSVGPDKLLHEVILPMQPHPKQRRSHSRNNIKDKKNLIKTQIITITYVHTCVLNNNSVDSIIKSIFVLFCSSVQTLIIGPVCRLDKVAARVKTHKHVKDTLMRCECSGLWAQSLTPESLVSPLTQFSVVLSDLLFCQLRNSKRNHFRHIFQERWCHCVFRVAF